MDSFCVSCENPRVPSSVLPKEKKKFSGLIGLKTTDGKVILPVSDCNRIVCCQCSHTEEWMEAGKATS